MVREIRAQNVQAAAGVVGSSPSEAGLDLQLSINAQGRLQTEQEFGEIIVQNGATREFTRLRDIARIELGAADYSLRSLLDNKSAVAVPIFQSPGSNAIEISDSVRKMMAELKANMPDGMDYSIVYDPTHFVGLDRGGGATCWKPWPWWSWWSSCSCRPGVRRSFR